MKITRKSILPLLLLLLFAAYQTGITAFTHAHYVNGVMIVHSHPFKDGHHHHTKSQLVVITQLSSYHTPKPEESFRLFVERSFFVSIEQRPVTAFTPKVHLKSQTLRAPPVVLS